MKKHYRHENDCLNCGTILEGKFCHHCGQENLQIKEDFGHMMNHAISDYFHFDHQFFHTIKPLLFKPGKLTNEYMAGKRVQYLHPIKMYIFISLIFFIFYFKHSQVSEDVKVYKTEKTNVNKVRNQINADTNLNKSAKRILDKAIVTGSAINLDDKGKESEEGFHIIQTDYPSYDKYLEAQNKLPASQRDNFIIRYFNKKEFDYAKHGGDEKEILMEAVKHNVPKMMFVLLPLFALILRLTFWSNKKFYVEHLIFSFHLHCFIFLFVTAAILLEMMLPESKEITGWINLIVMVVSTIYIYKALKAVYHRSRWRTISKMIGMSLSYLLVCSFCLFVVFIISAITAV
ncbi:DUF3667 domain-containing protein [Mucilaginibacter sp. KACC 22063]|uniref:DUF3667 domain-containing protein n=1 Tax=Mucilaginibacter sp. KACC 22063 TaxID=3025666 RepID=UPI0023668670|nr:DUF3667 domain-containing protein [Mucilaginibacter sp. KACC 22063]WDF53447.1 DUF3667 domain-containing protein [Mucilaginibacter sp. KACC 22063]